MSVRRSIIKQISPKLKVNFRHYTDNMHIFSNQNPKLDTVFTKVKKITSKTIYYSVYNTF